MNNALKFHLDIFDESHPTSGPLGVPNISHGIKVILLELFRICMSRPGEVWASTMRPELLQHTKSTSDESSIKLVDQVHTVPVYSTVYGVHY